MCFSNLTHLQGDASASLGWAIKLGGELNTNGIKDIQSRHLPTLFEVLGQFTYSCGLRHSDALCREGVLL